MNITWLWYNTENFRQKQHLPIPLSYTEEKDHSHILLLIL